MGTFDKHKVRLSMINYLHHYTSDNVLSIITSVLTYILKNPSCVITSISKTNRFYVQSYGISSRSCYSSKQVSASFKSTVRLRIGHDAISGYIWREITFCALLWRFCWSHTYVVFLAVAFMCDVREQGLAETRVPSSSICNETIH